MSFLKTNLNVLQLTKNQLECVKTDLKTSLNELQLT